MTAHTKDVAASAADASVSIRDLVISYGPLTILDRMSLDIGKGEFLVLLGPSGCGKSTLLNAVAGLLDITDGEIWINGRNVTWDEPNHRGIGMVFQSYALYPTMTVRGNLSFGLKIAGVPPAEIEERVGKAAEILQIGPLLDRKPSQLSGGQRQRVAIGRALVRDVKVFLFDEPLSNLDAKLRGELRVEIKRLHRDLGRTMIYVTHDQIEAMTLADRIAVMKGGKIQQLAAPDEIYNRPANKFVASFIGSPTMNFITGRLVQDGGTWVFRSPTGQLDLTGYQFREPPVECDVILGARPEHYTVVRGTLPGGLHAKVDMVENLGADAIVWLTGKDGQCSARVLPTEHYATGEDVTLTPSPTKLALFDKASEERI